MSQPWSSSSAPHQSSASHQFSAPPQFCTAAVSNPLPQAYATQLFLHKRLKTGLLTPVLHITSHHITIDTTNLVEDVSTQEDENVFLGNVCQFMLWFCIFSLEY